MKWQYWIELYTRTHCTARGLRPKTIAAYAASLAQFREYARVVWQDKPPDRVSPRDALEYVQHLREVRGNGDSAINRHVVILRSFYRAIVAMGHLEPCNNPMTAFPKIRAVPKKLPTVLTDQEVERLLAQPQLDTVLGLRDRALLALLYGTGVRASECAGLTEADVDLDEHTVRVTGKGGHQRVVPLNDSVVAALRVYREQRGRGAPRAPFFLSRRGRAMARTAVYERVRTFGQRARLDKRISPHQLRHTFATHLVRAGVGLVTIRDLLGHRWITSTQVYLHVTAEDLRSAAAQHPIGRLLKVVENFLPDVRLPLQYAPRRRSYG
jgi:site-specific recombinase XerD